MEVNQLSDRFNKFAEECKGSSELYEHLSGEIAKDEKLLQLSSYAQDGQPVPNLLFGAVHFLLLKGMKHDLEKFYLTMVESPSEVANSFPPFKDFCLTYQPEIQSILESRLVQTNEVRRCAYLYPAFSMVYEASHKPLTLIEVGTSAGLQLLWDQFSYSYGSGEMYGKLDSEVHISSSVMGGAPPVMLRVAPPVSMRIGLDLHVNDVAEEDDFLWLKALIWPEHADRRELFEQAASHLKDHHIRLIEGDAIELLPELINTVPKNTMICVFHTHVANQMTEDQKSKLTELIQTIGEEREISHLYNNMYDERLHLDMIIDGEEQTYEIGKTDGHGRWFEWNIDKS
ncbi:DUF2332 domain-containing protein [Halalkalibacillus halophilus]|uniref:DUF2332 domain-containing protein n=1 Tax=Halalkalibacillus halophilus TaxID=392827 RepID=UPI000428B1A7|nr:DUF2332 domain-containing protein [Halalkalibacillus halophilus]